MSVENSTNSCICKKIYEEGEVKVNDQDEWSVHQECYINPSLSEKIPTVFDN